MYGKGATAGSLLSFFLILTAVTSGLPAQEKGREAMNAVSEIRGLLDLQVAAWNRGDLEGFMAGYWKSEELTFVSQKTRTSGWKATLERYRKRYQSEGQALGVLHFEEIEIIPMGAEGAFVRGRFLLDQSGSQSSGPFTLILKKFPDGWKIIHDHTS